LSLKEDKKKRNLAKIKRNYRSCNYLTREAGREDSSFVITSKFVWPLQSNGELLTTKQIGIYLDTFPWIVCAYDY
jgi:hypothetical protein